jgi:hypothetical protein
MPIGVEELWQRVRQGLPSVAFEHMVVTFPATANQDIPIPTKLRPNNPEDILYRVVDYQFISTPAGTPCIYRDTSTTRHPWQVGNIFLRCTVASVVCTLELFVKRVQ